MVGERLTDRITLDKGTRLTIGLVVCLVGSLLAAHTYIDRRLDALEDSQEEKIDNLEDAVRELTYTVREMRRDQVDIVTVDRLRVWALRLAQNNPEMKVPDPQ